MKDQVNRTFIQRFIAKHLLKYYIFYLHNFNRTKLKHNLLTRKEKSSPACIDCGLCCVNCVAYKEDKHLCEIWLRTYITRCREFPITPLQLKLDNLTDKCRYYWEDEK